MPAGRSRHGTDIYSMNQYAIITVLCTEGKAWDTSGAWIRVLTSPREQRRLSQEESLELVPVGADQTDKDSSERGVFVEWHCRAKALGPRCVICTGTMNTFVSGG
jgi:hypothetical protein